MAEVAIIFMIVIGVIVITALIFFAWMFVVILRGIGRAIGLWPSPAEPARVGRGPMHPHALLSPLPGQLRCDRSLCHADNPVGVRFCRRCGNRFNAMVAARPAVGKKRVRRAAVV